MAKTNLLLKYNRDKIVELI